MKTLFDFSPNRRMWLTLLALTLSLAACSDTPSTTQDPPAQKGLRDYAELLGIHFGTAVNDELIYTDPIYADILTREFNSLTPAERMKWGAMHPDRDTWIFEHGDRLVSFAEKHNIRVRGTTLVFPNVPDPPDPAYLKEITTADAMRTELQNYISTVVGRYKGRVAHWDVANEPIAKIHPTPEHPLDEDNPYFKALGEEYISVAFHAARAADPDAKLYINDNRMLAPGPRQDAYFNLIRRLLDQGVPVDGIGFQGHSGGTWGMEDLTRAEIDATLDRFSTFGLEMEITELNYFLIGNDAENSEEIQPQRYADIVGGCLDQPTCKGVTVWLFTDKYPTTAENRLGFDDKPLMFDDDYKPKPAYDAVYSLLVSTATESGLVTEEAAQ